MRKAACFEFIYYLFYSFLMGLSVLYNANALAGVETDKKEIIVFMSVVVLIDLFTHINTRWRLILFGTVAAICAGFFFMADEETFDLLMQQRWLLFVLPLAFGSYFFSMLVFKLKYTRIVLGAVCIGFLVFLGVGRREVSQTGVGFILITVLAFVTDEIQCHIKRNGYVDNVQHFVLSMPFFAVILVILLLVPAPAERYEWGWAKAFARSVSDLAHKIVLSFTGNDEYFDSVMGFDEDGGMSGDISSGGKVMMTIDSQTAKNGFLYLSGKSFNRFDGKGWDEDAADICGNTMIDTLETMCAIENVNGIRDDYVNYGSLNMTYMEMSSKYVFTPLKSVIVKTDKDVYGLEYGDGGVLFNGQKGFKDDYPVKWYILNRDSESFRELILGRTEITEECWNNRQKSVDWMLYDTLDYEDYLKYRDSVYKDYTDEPVLSERMRSLLDELLDGIDNKYDRLKCIEAFLGSMEYNLSPGKIPSEVDDAGSYLDYLIFDSKKGYCSYYATAFVLLARAEGLPARYVQGYRVPLSAADSIEVNSSMAHAWPEVYFEGVGWIDFEPTPGYKTETRWDTVSEKKESGKYATNTEQYMHKITEKSDTERNGQNKAEEKKSFTIKWNMVALTIGVVALIAVLIYFVDGILTKRRYKSLTELEKAKVLCRRNMNLLKYLGYELNDGETLEEFAGRCRMKLSAEDMEFIECYERLSYDLIEDGNCVKGDAEKDAKSDADPSGVAAEEKVPGSDIGKMIETVERCYTCLMLVLKKEKPLGYILFSLRN